MTHALQVLTSLDEDATVVSIDEVGAFDPIFRVDGHGARRHVVAIRPTVLRPTVVIFVGG